MNKKGFSLIELLIVIVIIGIIVIIAVPSLLESKKTAQATSAAATLRNIASAEVSYSSKLTHQGVYGDAAALVSEGFLDDRFTNTPAHFDGYSFSIAATGAHFTATATPDYSTNPTFYIDDTMVLKYANGTPVGH